MGRLPKTITSDSTPKLSHKKWIWGTAGLIALGVYAYYSMMPFQPSALFQHTSLKPEILEVSQEMEEPTIQDLQALPITQETGEEEIAVEDLQNDELIKIFRAQEQKHAQNPAQLGSKPQEPLVVKRSLGLV